MCIDLDALPTTESCCFFMKNLRIACFLIGITNLVKNLVWDSPQRMKNLFCEQIFVGYDFFPIFMTVLWICVTVTVIMVIAAAFGLIIGLYFQYNLVLKIYIYVSLIAAFMSLLFCVMAVLQTMAWSAPPGKCKKIDLMAPLLAAIVYFLIEIYFSLVVNSYRLENI